MLAVTLVQFHPIEPTLLILSTDTGAVRARGRGWVSLQAWSADNRYVAFSAERDSSLRDMVGILNVQTGQSVTLRGTWWDWSPDSKWLAVTQDNAGVLLVTPDLSSRHRIAENLDCPFVAWRPKR